MTANQEQLLELARRWHELATAATDTSRQMHGIGVRIDRVVEGGSIAARAAAMAHELEQLAAREGNVT